MKKFWIYLFFLGAVTITACDKDGDGHDHEDETTEYSIQIMSPSADDKKVDDMIHLHINFDEANSGTIHHVNVKIYEDGNTDNVIYDGPSEAHVHEESGHFEHHADFMLNADNGVEGHTNWILEAKVWGHEAGKHEVMMTRGFHVHPN